MKRAIWTKDNGNQIVDMTADEKTEWEERTAAWESGAKNRKLAEIRELRNNRLKETDYMANSDVTMPDYIKTWRQTLRDLPQNNTTESQYDALLARDNSTPKKLTNSIWKQPTS